MATGLQYSYTAPLFFNNYSVPSYSQCNKCISLEKEIQFLREELLSTREIINILRSEHNSIQEVVRHSANNAHNDTSTWSKVFRKSPNIQSKPKMEKTRNNQPIPVITNRFAVLQEKNSPENQAENVTNKEKSDDARNKAKHTGTTKERKENIILYTDSHGRGLAANINHKQKSFKCTGYVKPGATMKQVTQNVAHDAQSLGNNDFIVIMAGSNDLSKNNSSTITSDLQHMLNSPSITKKNIIVCNIPHRHDLEQWSCVNKEVKRTNARLKLICNQYPNVSLVNLTAKKELHTRHGLHFNSKGKEQITEQICAEIKSREVTKDILPLPDINQTAMKHNLPREERITETNLDEKKNQQIADDIQDKQNSIRQNEHAPDSDNPQPKERKEKPTSSNTDRGHTTDQDTEVSRKSTPSQEECLQKEKTVDSLINKARSTRSTKPPSKYNDFL